MARKFDEITVDGGKRERKVVVKIDHPSGLFEAEMDGSKYRGESYAALKDLLHAAAAKHDELPYEAFYKLSFRYSFDVQAVAVSAPVVVEGVRRPRRGPEPEPVRRVFKLDMGADYSVPSPVNTGQDIGTLYERDTDTLVAVTPESTAALREFMARIQALEEEEEGLEEKQRTLRRARDGVINEIQAAFGKAEDC